MLEKRAAQRYVQRDNTTAKIYTKRFDEGRTFHKVASSPQLTIAMILCNADQIQRRMLLPTASNSPTQFGKTSPDTNATIVHTLLSDPSSSFFQLSLVF